MPIISEERYGKHKIADAIVTKEEIVIPAGTVLRRAPQKTVRQDFHGEAVLGFGSDGVGYFTIDQESAELNPDLFHVYVYS